MTKQEIQQLMGMLFFGIALYLFSKDFVFAFGLPVGLYVFGFSASRAFGASWVVRLDEEEAVFREACRFTHFIRGNGVGHGRDSHIVGPFVDFKQQEGGCRHRSFRPYPPYADNSAVPLEYRSNGHML